VSFRVGHRVSASRLLEKAGAKDLVKNPDFVQDVRIESTPITIFILTIAAVIGSFAFLLCAHHYDLPHLGIARAAVIKIHN
jgi:hypothetical protein